jgi:hypothetical protein
MSKITFHLALVVAGLVGLLPAAPAQAQSIRTFVSQAGTDNPTCTITSPCRHFSAAVAATSLGGEVDALDPGGYGSFTITQAISIEGQGWAYVAPPANGAAITINAGSGDVNIRGVSLNGVSVSGATGIQFNAGASLHVQNSVIRNFANDGILFAPSAASQLLVSNTLAADNGGSGFRIFPSGTAAMTVVLDHVAADHNAINGIFVDSSTAQTLNVTVSDSVSASNAQDGMFVFANGPSTIINVLARNSTFAHNVFDGVQAVGPGATVRLTRSTITANGVGWGAGSSATVSSYADNNIDGNTAANNAPTPIVYK